MSSYVVGIDFGTNSARAIVVDYNDGNIIGTAVAEYAHGDKGILLDPANPNVARHHPADYPTAARQAVRSALDDATRTNDFRSRFVVGLGIAATASTPMPVDVSGSPGAMQDVFTGDLNAMAWLWKDHSATDEAEQITRALQKSHPDVLARIGGSYSSEWFWSKALRCARIAPETTSGAASWVEVADWFTGLLVGQRMPGRIARNICMAGHKGLFDARWGGYPPTQFLEDIDSGLRSIARSMTGPVQVVGQTVGTLAPDGAELLGLPAGIAIGVPGIDAHMGALGSGIGPGRMAKIMGTSGVDLVVVQEDSAPRSVPGLSGVIPDSIVPGFVTVEGGQSAIGDVYGWFVEQVKPGRGMKHEDLTAEARKLRPGATGLLGLDWQNGNRTVLGDQRLSGLIIGLNLHTQPAHIYRALIEATAFGSRVIMDRLEEYGIVVNDIVTSGGLPLRNDLVMQVFADVLARPLRIARSDQTGALGSAISGAVAADRQAGRPVSVLETVNRMTGFLNLVYRPDQTAVPVYNELYTLYRRIHNAFGTPDCGQSLFSVMKKLIEIRERFTG